MSHIPCHHNPMKNQLILGVLLVGLVMLAIILFAQKKPEYFSGFVPDEIMDMETGGKSLEEIRLDGISRYCTFDYKKGNEYFSGNFLTFGGNVNLSLISKQKKDVTFFLFDNQRVYTWKSNESQGLSYVPNPLYVYKHDRTVIDLHSIRDAVCWEKPIDRVQFLLPPDIDFFAE